jgi:hypothetical protein
MAIDSHASITQVIQGEKNRDNRSKKRGNRTVEEPPETRPSKRRKVVEGGLSEPTNTHNALSDEGKPFIHLIIQQVLTTTHGYPTRPNHFIHPKRGQF